MSSATRTVSATVTVVLALLLSAVGARAQQADTDTGSAAPMPGQPGQLQIPDSIRAKIAEFQKIQGRLNDLQQKALNQSEDLRAEEDSLQQTVQNAMLEQDPDLKKNLDRMDSLRSQMDSARSQQDQASMMRISSQAQKLRGQLQNVQDRAMQKPEVRDQMKTFQEDLLAQMKSIDSDTQDLIDRLQTLAKEFQTFQESHIEQAAPSAPPEPDAAGSPDAPPNR